VRREDVPRFLRGLHDRLGPGARVMILDNRFAEGSSTPIARADASGNTYQRRTLANGAEYEALKNFPAADDVRDSLHRVGACSIEVVELPYYWYATYDIG
jgi:hypothetical protein